MDHSGLPPGCHSNKGPRIALWKEWSFPLGKVMLETWGTVYTHKIWQRCHRSEVLWVFFYNYAAHHHFLIFSLWFKKEKVRLRLFRSSTGCILQIYPPKGKEKDIFLEQYNNVQCENALTSVIGDCRKSFMLSWLSMLKKMSTFHWSVNLLSRCSESLVCSQGLVDQGSN